ncbi:MAG: 6-phosphofructokinase [Oscillospiraceae bacterium]|nr:6-phosphofructokinase [Oscillospiraceae bacterium]
MTQKLIGACVLAQSGGPTAVINASAYGVIKTAMESEEITRVFGAAHGITGILNDMLYDLDKEDPEELKFLMNTPSSELGSCRYKLEGEKDLARILEIFKKYDIRYFFYNGGNDSMDTCLKVSEYMMESGYECRVIGVPKTIDNDLVGTDHCPGYGSAAKYIATSFAEVYKDAIVYNTGAITVLEVMGRNAGWLVGASALAGLSNAAPDLIYLPEVPFNLDDFLDKVEAIYKEKNNCVVAVSEGIKYSDGTFVSEAKPSTTDGFGHEQLGGLAATLAAVVGHRTGAKVRGIELSLLQRCGAHLASQVDIDEAYLAGKCAVESAIAGENGKMVALNRVSNNGEYGCEIIFQPLTVSANLEKTVPLDWINSDGTNVTQDFIDYVLPLIQGENTRVTVNGLPRFANLKKIKAEA